MIDPSSARKPLRDRPDLLVFSHVRWTAVPERARRVLVGLAPDHRVFFVEEPIREGATPGFSTRSSDGITVVVPRLPRAGLGSVQVVMDRVVANLRVHRPIGWYLSPSLRSATRHLSFGLVVWDRADDAASLVEPTGAERDLLCAADVVFTTSVDPPRAPPGTSKVCALPPLVDVDRWSRISPSPVGSSGAERAAPWRLGCPVERDADVALLRAVARHRVAWRVLVAGAPDTGLPPLANVSYRPRDEVLDSADVVLLPVLPGPRAATVARDAVEAVAAGRPVVTTSWAAVPHSLVAAGWVRRAEGPEQFALEIGRFVRDGTRTLPARGAAVQPFGLGELLARVRAHLAAAVAWTPRPSTPVVAGPRAYGPGPGSRVGA